MALFVGIDLGTTYSVVTYINDQGKPEVVPNSYGRNVTPSVIYFGADAPIVGDEAKEHQAFGSTEVASFFKRVMGNPEFRLTFNGREYTAVDLSALILAYLKAQAEQFSGVAVTDAVITVPAYFKEPQRSATIEAGQQAGLNVLKIISEPTAAALAYGLHPGPEMQSVLVYDLGGGTFDISLVLITPTSLEVIATGGDATLGGKDWDDRLINYLEAQFFDEFSIELVGDDANELRVQAEKLKHSLSKLPQATVRVQASGRVGTYSITREYFESLTRDLMERTQTLTEQVMREAGISWSDLTGVLPVGGSTRMPMVQDYITRMSGKPPMGGIHPEEAVGLGAAIQAAMEIEAQLETSTMRLSGRKTTVDVIAHSLGLIVESADRSRYVNSIIIPKNRPIPATQMRLFKKAIERDGNTELEVFLTQSESDDPQLCTYLGRYVFTDFPPTNERAVLLDITYEYDKNGIVHISAVEQVSGKVLTMARYPVPGDVPERFSGRPVSINERLSVYLAFDVSGSMCGEPMAEAQKAAREFVSHCDLTSTSVGLIAFSDRVHVEQYATQDQQAISRAIDSLHCGSTGGGNGTDPFDQIYELYSNVSDLRYAIVLADGVWAYQEAAVERAQRCHQAGIQVIAIGFGYADRLFLDRMASSTEQSFFTSMNGLSATFGTIAQELAESIGERRRGGKLSMNQQQE